jgi:uncharacterized membrane protein YgcG
MGARLVTFLVVSVAAVGLVAAPAAEATFHLIKVREVFPGSVAHPDAGYVELQMYSGGQGLVQNGNIRVFDAAGAVTHSFTPSHAVGNDGNQSTVLIADSAYADQFPTAPAPDFSDSNLNLSPAGGAVCWPQTEPPFDDCASWGNFSGQAMLASTDAAPAAPGGIPDGMALRRSVAPGCATLLEDSDDHDSSATDFAVTAPEPRPNAVAPSEHGCGGGGGGAAGNGGAGPGGGGAGGGGGGRNAPQTILSGKPAKRSRDRTPTFRFRADEAGVSFECKLDAKPFHACRSPFAAHALSFEAHGFKVRARDDSGDLDPTPASYAFRITRKPR